MRLRVILLVGLALVLLPASNNMQAQSGGNYDVQWNVIGGSAGEGFVTGGNYQLGFTLAQAQEPQVSSGGNYQVVGGFWFEAPVTDTYLITPTAGMGGSITPSTPQIVDHGESITFTITPDLGYHILDVGVDGTSVGALTSYTFNNVTASHTISAAFAPDEYTLAVDIVGQGIVTRVPNQPTYLYGDVVTLTATPDSGWYFGQWSGNASGALPQTTLMMDADKVVTATFLATPPTYYTLTMSLVGSGVITPTVGAHSYLAGTVVNLSASPAAGWQFAGWSGAVVTTTNPLMLTMDAVKSVTATFVTHRVYLPIVTRP